MSPVSGGDPDAAARRRRARRIARELHPDRGGDPAAYLEAMATLTGVPPSEAPAPPAEVKIRQRRWGTLPGLTRRRWRAWRRHRRQRPGSGWTQL